MKNSESNFHTINLLVPKYLPRLWSITEPLLFSIFKEINQKEGDVEETMKIILDVIN